MSNAVLISIHPRWCERIASGEKTIEVRKTAPKIETPFKCYIYCTKSTDHPRGWLGCYNHDMHRFGLISPLNIEAGKHMNIEVVSGKVIGEFVCNKIKRIDIPFPAYWPELDKSVLYGTGLSLTEIHDYLGHRSGYGWHISDLKIYDEPKPLKQFQIPTTFPARRVRQAPQSWCYIEEVE